MSVSNNMSVSNIQNVATPQPIIQSIRKVLSKISDVAQKVFNKIKEAYAACKDAFVAFKAKVMGSPVRQPRQAISESTVSSINPPTLIPYRDAAATIIQKNFRGHRSRVANPVKSENVESAPLAPVIAAVTPANTVTPSKNLKYGNAALGLFASAAFAVFLKQNPQVLNQIVNDSKVVAGLALETGTRLSDKVVDGVSSGVKVATEVARKIVAENLPKIQTIKGGFAYNFRS